MSVLQRELDAYNDALAYYNRGLQNYNKKAETYNASFLQDSSGNRYVYEKPYQDVGIVYDYVYDPFFQAYMPVAQYVPFTAGNKYYIVDASGKLTPTAAPTGSYKLENLSGNYQTLRINPDEKGAYPTKPAEWTKVFDMKKPDPTVAAVKKLDDPTLADIERNIDKGLISNAFNF